MAFEGLSEKLNETFKRLRGKGRLTESDVKAGLREVRLALLEADVSYKVVKDFIARVTDRCVGSDVLESLTPAQQIVKIVNQELTELMGGSNARLATASKGPTVVMMVESPAPVKPLTAQSWRASCAASMANGPCWWPATCTAPPPSSSCRWWASSWTFPFLRWARATR